MIRRKFVFKKVVIIGVGLMGGSIGLAIKKQKLAKEVVGVSHRQSSLVQAIKYKAIDVGSTEIPKALKGADLVILATPVDSIIKLITIIRPHVKRGMIITDVGSSKVEIVETAKKTLPNPEFFIGSHPIVGSDKTGVEFAKAELFENTKCMITPVPETHKMVNERVKYFWTQLGANVKSVSPDEHDQIFGYLSHLPHVLAFSLIESIPDAFTEYNSQSLRDMTRIAGSSPQLWNDICMSNTKNIINSIDGMVKNLALVRKAIVERDSKTLTEHFQKAVDKKNKFNDGNQS